MTIRRMEPSGLGLRIGQAQSLGLLGQMVRGGIISGRIWPGSENRKRESACCFAVAPCIVFRHHVVCSSLRNLVLSPRDR